MRAGVDQFALRRAQEQAAAGARPRNAGGHQHLARELTSAQKQGPDWQISRVLALRPSGVLEGGRVAHPPTSLDLVGLFLERTCTGVGDGGERQQMSECTVEGFGRVGVGDH